MVVAQRIIEVRSDPAVIKAYLGEPEHEELPPEVASDLKAEGIL